MTGDEPPPADVRTVGDALETRAAEGGEEPYLHYRNREVSVAALDRRANGIAAALRDRGVGHGDTVGLLLYNSPAYIAATFALAKLGAVAAPVDTRFAGETLADVLSRLDATAVLIDADTRQAYEAVRADVSGHADEYFVGGAAGDLPYRDFEDLVAERETFEPEQAVEASDPFSVTFVQRRASERPSGVVLPHYAYVNSGWAASHHLFEFGPEDRIFTTLPLYSAFTFQVGVMGALLGDAAFVMGGPFDPDRFWEQIGDHDATVFLYLSRMLSVLKNRAVGPDGGTTPADWAIGHGFGFDTDETLIRNFEDRFGVTVLEGYGVTQTGALATFNRPDDRRIGSVGRPVPHVSLEVVDDEDWPVETGETGEIVVRPDRPHTMLQRYHDDPDRTVRDTRNQWIHTGGLGYRDEDGYVYFVARRENSIYRGRIAGRISALEIESVIDSLPGVRESAVVGVTTETGGEEILAVVVPEADADVSPIDVCRHCEQRLPYLKVPRYISVRDGLPRSSSGKIRKTRLRREDAVDAWDRESGYDLSR